MTLLYAIVGADVLLAFAASETRVWTATVLQLGIAAGVGALLVLQSKVAERDDAAWRAGC